MFSNLTNRLSAALQTITGKGKLTESNINDSLREVRKALLEADVALSVVTDFIEHIKQRALGAEILTSLSPSQTLIKIVHEELVVLMGEHSAELNLKSTPPVIILVAGLQGAGKTTSTAKLALNLKERKNRKVMMVSTDVYRPAAREQLAKLGEQISVPCFIGNDTDSPIEIAKKAIAKAKVEAIDTILVDTAGRLHIDEEMMLEIKELHKELNPTETLFVVDSMTGQDAANTAKAFNEALPLTGVILTKADGDARGGAALSIRQITGKPIKFIGTGEKVVALDAFYPERIASRILGMGDVLSLIEEAERTIDKKQAEKASNRLKKGQFNLEDFRDQIIQMNKMGGISGLLDKLPGVSSLPKNAVNEKEVVKIKAIIDSMTKKERKFPQIIKGSRKRRIALGSGTHVQDINKLLKQFTQMQKMMKKMNKAGGMKKMMQQVQSLMGGKGLPRF